MEVTWFFNSDLEDYLASDNTHYPFNSNKRNQELEYFLFWLEKEKVYTTKKYDESYLRFIQSLRGSSVETTQQKNHLKAWNSDITNKQLLKILNSKLTSYQFAIANHLACDETQFYKLGDEIKPHYIYKQAFGVSGIGTWRGDLARDKIQEISLTEELVCEPKLDRFFDFSTCVTETQDYVYQNQVDEFFHYKGTTLGINFESFSWFKEYQENITKIKNHYQSLGIARPYSIDSFLYRKEGKEYVYTLSEVNARKTMGYIAIALWQKYFLNFRYCRLHFVNRKKCRLNFNHSEIFQKFSGQIICLSPLDNLFLTFLTAENSLHDLNELDDDLFSTIFKSVE
jgi:hypothetical protein